MAPMNGVHEVDSNITWPRYPGLLQEVYQWKPKPKGKKQKSQIDDTRTEISYSASTAAGDVDFDTSTFVSKDFGTPSSRSVESKRSKKRSKKSLKDPSGSVHSDARSSPEITESSKDPFEPSYLVTLKCPLCDDPNCILNKSSLCPLLRHNDPPDTVFCCKFCTPNCQCETNKGNFRPVSGLVQRDENGIAVSLLKANGGPIENSYEWANRRRWDVPSRVRWEHKISEWVTAPTLENMKAEEGSHRKKLHKQKNKRKSRATPLAMTTPLEIASNGEESRTEDDDQEMKLIVDGDGFKIFSKGQEKILINYERKNCKYMGCSCVPVADSTNCGCGDIQSGGAKATKHHKNCANRPKRISLLKETSHGLEPMNKELEAKYTKEKTKSCDSGANKNESVDKYDAMSTPTLKKGESVKREAQQQKIEKEKPRKVNLTGKDIRNESRAEILAISLKSIDDDHKMGESEQAEREKQDSYASVPCPGLDQALLGACTCAFNCCSTT